MNGFRYVILEFLGVVVIAVVLHNKKDGPGSLKNYILSIGAVVFSYLGVQFFISALIYSRMNHFLAHPSLILDLHNKERVLSYLLAALTGYVVAHIAPSKSMHCVLSVAFLLTGYEILIPIEAAFRVNWFPLPFILWEIFLKTFHLLAVLVGGYFAHLFGKKGK